MPPNHFHEKALIVKVDVRLDRFADGDLIC